LSKAITRQRVHERLIAEYRRRESRRVIKAYHRGEKSKEEAEEELTRKAIPFISR